MLITMGSSPIESVVAAGNIFIGQVSCNIKKIKQSKRPAEVNTLPRKWNKKMTVISFHLGEAWQKHGIFSIDNIQMREREKRI